MINKNDVKYVAALSRIHLEDDQLDGFTKNLEDILTYVEKLNELDVSNVKPTSHVLDVENVFRTDEDSSQLTQDEALSIAVEKDAGCFKVPKVIE